MFDSVCHCLHSIHILFLFLHSLPETGCLFYICAVESIWPPTLYMQHAPILKHESCCICLAL